MEGCVVVQSGESPRLTPDPVGAELWVTLGGSEFCTTQDGTELSWLKAGSRSVDDTEVLQQSVGGVVESFFEGTTPLGNWLMDSSEIREELFAFRIDRHKFVLTLVALLEEWSVV